MKQNFPNKTLQIKSILNGRYIDSDIETGADISKMIGIKTFDQIYNISVEDVMLYVDSAGWNPNVVQVTSAHPIYNGGSPSYFIWDEPNNIKVMVPMDRGEWLETKFTDRKLAREYIVKSLIWSKWGDVNYAWVKRNIRNNTRPLEDLFIPPCGLKHGVA